jgi:ubiquitin carboxyl-terminal hydrolase 5/13
MHHPLSLSSLSLVCMQDAAEYLDYFIQEAAKYEQKSDFDPASPFAFTQEERLECLGCHGVRYRAVPQEAGGLAGYPVPLAVDPSDGDGKQAALVKVTDDKQAEATTLDACIRLGAAPDMGDGGYRCPACQTTTVTKKTSRFLTFPEVLVVRVNRFYLNGLAPKKLNMKVDAPESLDLDSWGLRAGWMQDGETPLPDSAPSSAPAPQPDAGQVAAIMGMGFSENAAKRSVLAVHSAGAVEASNWAMVHMEDADFNAPLASNSSSSSSSSASGADNAEQVAAVMGMGFPKDRAAHALSTCNNDVARAVDWLFSNPDAVIPAAVAAPDPAAAQDANVEVDQGAAKYSLTAAITHLGESTASGHYVAHVFDAPSGKWVLFNDSKVSVDANEDNSCVQVAYLLFYSRDA